MSILYPLLGQLPAIDSASEYRRKREVKTNLEFWFTPPEAQKLATPYKQFLRILSAFHKSGRWHFPFI